jgi:hypothetical protein
MIGDRFIRLIMRRGVALLLVLVMVAAQDKIYTNQEAYQCFHDIAVDSCSQQLTECMKTSSCQSEMERFNSCAFDDSPKEAAKIFNGYCFKRWLDRA